MVTWNHCFWAFYYLIWLKWKWASFWECFGHVYQRQVYGLCVSVMAIKASSVKILLQKMCKMLGGTLLQDSRVINISWLFVIKSKVATRNAAKMGTKGGSLEVPDRSSLLIVNPPCAQDYFYLGPGWYEILFALCCLSQQNVLQNQFS